MDPSVFQSLKNQEEVNSLLSDELDRLDREIFYLKVQRAETKIDLERLVLGIEELMGSITVNNLQYQEDIDRKKNLILRLEKKLARLNDEIGKRELLFDFGFVEGTEEQDGDGILVTNFDKEVMETVVDENYYIVSINIIFFKLYKTTIT